MQLPLLDFMLWLEQLAYHIRHVTHPSRNVHLDVKRSGSTSKVAFHFTRGSSGKQVIIDVQLTADGRHTERVRIGKHVIDELADLKDCICARLSPSLRVLNLLKLIMRDHLKLVFMKHSNQQKLVVVVPGSSKSDIMMEIWLDENDALKVRGRSCLAGTRTYQADQQGPVHEGKKAVFYFEDPFATQEDGAVHALMPGTLLFLTDVLGTVGFETLDMWVKPELAEVRRAVERRQSPGMTIVDGQTSVKGNGSNGMHGAAGG
jgi:hypothetical protein